MDQSAPFYLPGGPGIFSSIDWDRSGGSKCIGSARSAGRRKGLTTDIPTGIAQKLDIRPGQEIVWIEDDTGYHVMLLDEKREMLLIHEEIIGEYGEVFDALSKS